MLKGSELEKYANKANYGYRKIKKAWILKIPVPILYTKKGMVAQQSTVDFAGLVNGGQFIAFDAKETKKGQFLINGVETIQFITNKVKFVNYKLYVDVMNNICYQIDYFISIDNFVKLQEAMEASISTIRFNK